MTKLENIRAVFAALQRDKNIFEKTTALILCSLMFVVSAVILFIHLRCPLDHATRNWAQVQGVVLSSEIFSATVSPNRKQNQSKELGSLAVRYRYTVNGTIYTNDKVWHCKDTWLDATECQTQLDALKQNLTVYYEEKDPENSYLLKNEIIQRVGISGACTLLLFIAIACIFRNLWNFHRIHRLPDLSSSDPILFRSCEKSGEGRGCEGFLG
jgi:Protein of unknown function (DUF3592)